LNDVVWVTSPWVSNPQTLSGGRGSRVPWPRSSLKKDTGKTFYILDEPNNKVCISKDIGTTYASVSGLVDKGNTVLIMKHKLEHYQDGRLHRGFRARRRNKGGQ